MRIKLVVNAIGVFRLQNQAGQLPQPPGVHELAAAGICSHDCT